MGTWRDRYQNVELPWLRWWDNQGNPLLTTWENTQRWQRSLKEFGVNPR